MAELPALWGFSEKVHVKSRPRGQAGMGAIFETIEAAANLLEVWLRGTRAASNSTEPTICPALPCPALELAFPGLLRFLLLPQKPGSSSECTVPLGNVPCREGY